MSSWLDRLWNRSSAPTMPQYALLERQPTRCLPKDLQDLEAADQHRARCRAVEQDLLSVRRPPDDAALLVSLAGQGAGEFVTFELPDGSGRCLPVFTSPLRAGDYTRTVLRGLRVRYLVSSPIQFLAMARDLAGAGMAHIALDRCPRCKQFNAYATASIRAVEQVLAAWAISRGIQEARADLYLGYALAAARSGRHAVARDVALELIGHVAIDDPRAHFLLGRLGLAMDDDALTREAAAFLAYLHRSEWVDALRQVAPGEEYFGTLPWPAASERWARARD